MKRNLYYLLSLAVIGGALAGCDTDEDAACTVATAAADCGGYVCVVADGEAEGVCATTASEGCAPGYVADGELCVASTVTCDTLECGSYACDETTNTCFTDCTADNVGTNCAEGASCEVVDGEDAGVCAAAPEYTYVAVVSRAQGDTALNNPNPGPDLDGISIEAAGNETFATVIESFAQGAEGDEANTRPLSTHAEAVQAKDTVDAGGTCDLEAQPGYVAIGGDGGFIAVSFGRALVTGDTITVYEVDSNYCSDAATERPDAYDVYVGSGDGANVTLDDITTGWCLVGNQGGNGGVFTTAFNADTCAM